MSGKTRILITRPKEQAEAFKRRVEKEGREYECLIAPVLQIEYRDVSIQDCKYDALIFTSANAASSIGKQSFFDFSTPVLCVGQKTALKAKEAGFSNIHHVAKNVQALCEYMAAGKDNFRSILYLRGMDISFGLKEELGNLGIKITEHIVYEAIKSSKLPEEILRDLKASKIDIITFFSARSAGSFIELIESQKITLGTTKALCISHAVLESLSGYFKDRVYVSRTPDEDSMIEALVNLS
ncbi:MAG: uroporphyrinogen-III synthase [Alphaproteobacteria bacterium]|nr:uroporphyrinogen-III synthase [Alphaproteobacteria bacterium]